VGGGDWRTIKWIRFPVHRCAKHTPLCAIIYIYIVLNCTITFSIVSVVAGSFGRQCYCGIDLFSITVALIFHVS